MDRRERFEDMHEALLAALAGWQSGLWTALPAEVVSFNAEEMTIVAQPTIQARMREADGTMVWVTMPLLPDVPVCFPNGGGYTLTFPIAPGDEVLVVLASRCIDAWWQSSGVQVQAELRMHDLSDGFAIPGPRSKPRALPDFNTTNVELRSEDGSVKIEVAAAEINIIAPVVNVKDGGAVKKLVNDLFKPIFDNHFHTNVQGGVGVSGPPSAAMPANNLTSVLKAE